MAGPRSATRRSCGRTCAASRTGRPSRSMGRTSGTISRTGAATGKSTPYLITCRNVLLFPDRSLVRRKDAQLALFPSSSITPSAPFSTLPRTLSPLPFSVSLSDIDSLLPPPLLVWPGTASTSCPSLAGRKGPTCRCSGRMPGGIGDCDALDVVFGASVCLLKMKSAVKVPCGPVRVAHGSCHGSQNQSSSWLRTLVSVLAFLCWAV